MTWWDKIVKALAAAAGVAAGLYGGFDTMLLVLVAFMAIDYVTGLAVACWAARTRRRPATWTARWALPGCAGSA